MCVLLCALPKHVHTSHCVFMHVRMHACAACVRQRSIFGAWVPGGEREGAGAWQAEGQT